MNSYGRISCSELLTRRKDLTPVGVTNEDAEEERRKLIILIRHDDEPSLTRTQNDYTVLTIVDGYRSQVFHKN